jgi:hypothetical protein
MILYLFYLSNITDFFTSDNSCLTGYCDKITKKPTAWKNRSSDGNKFTDIYDVCGGILFCHSAGHSLLLYVIKSILVNATVQRRVGKKQTFSVEFGRS